MYKYDLLDKFVITLSLLNSNEFSSIEQNLQIIIPTLLPELFSITIVDKVSEIQCLTKYKN